MIPPAKKLDLWAWLGCVVLALAFRLPGLTVFLTADEARSWFGRSRIFFDALLQGDWSNTAPGGQVPFIENVSLSPAPGVTTMWAGALGIGLEYLRQGAPGSLLEFGRTIPFDPLDPAMLFTLRLPGVLVAALAVGLTYRWSRPFLGRQGAFLAAALLALDPFSLALSRILGHDAFASTFTWLSLLALIRAATEDGRQKDEGGKENFILLPSAFILSSGAFAGLACLSKYPALSIGLFTAATTLLTYFWQNKINATGNRAEGPLVAQHTTMLGRWLKDMVWWSLAAVVVFVLLWPAMWVDPLGPVTAILNDALRASGGAHPKGSFFWGQPVPDPGWLFYPIVALFRTTPVVLVGIGLLLWQVVSRRMANGRIGEALEQQQADPASSRFTLHASLILLAYILFYTLLVTYGGKKQDRYLLPIFPPLTMLAAMGYLYVSRFTFHVSRFRHHAPRATWLLPLIILMVQAAFVLPTYPYYFSFYNPLAGGGQAAARLMQVGWGEGLNEAAAFLNTLPNAETLKLVSWYSTTFEPYFKGHSIYEIDDEKISRSPKPGLAADYVVVYVNQVQRQLPSEGALQFFQASASPVYTVTLNGLDYAWIYPSLSLPHVLAGEARLVGQAELLGYRLTDEAGRPVTTAYPESVVLISLYWEWQGQAEGDKLRISLVDDNNQTRGYGNPIETVAPVARAEWRDGMVVRDDFALVIFPDTPPGEYRLAAWIERPATGETVGVFPLEETFQIVPLEVVTGGSGE